LRNILFNIIIKVNNCHRFSINRVATAAGLVMDNAGKIKLVLLFKLNYISVPHASQPAVPEKYIWYSGGMQDTIKFLF
jgi:hypothetical protein